jgi:ribosomal protein L12E/L44/L45/RPP1/RPP2
VLRNLDSPAALAGVGKVPFSGSVRVQYSPQALRIRSSVSEERSNADAGKIRHLQNKAIKLAHELNDVDEGSTGDKTSYAKQAAGGASTNKEAEAKTDGKDEKEEKEDKEEDKSEPADAKEKDVKKAQSEGGKVRLRSGARGVTVH